MSGRWTGTLLVGLVLIMVIASGSWQTGDLHADGPQVDASSTATPPAIDSAEPAQVMAALDSLALSRGAGQVHSWYVDVPAQQVVVTTPRGATDSQSQRFLSQAMSYGSLVRVEQQQSAVRTTSNLYGGQGVKLSDGYVCTTGFNARTASGAAVMITAGHCATGRPSFFRKGVKIGATDKFSFPRNDYAIFKVNSKLWKPRASVVRWDGRVQAVRSSSKVKVGTTVCKSGQSTHWTCGKVKAYNETVNFGHGQIVSGLVRHTACVEDGDSGGAVMSGTEAQGITSGAELWKKGSRYVCGAKVGRTSVSYYQPIGEVLSAYKLKLLVR